MKRNLTGLRFGRLTVIRETSERAADGGIIWECLCDCGKTCFVWGNKLTRKGHSQKRSCGCLQEETHHTKTHGESKSVLFHKWTGMKDRCYNRRIIHPLRKSEQRSRYKNLGMVEAPGHLRQLRRCAQL